MKWDEEVIAMNTKAYKILNERIALANKEWEELDVKFPFMESPLLGYQEARLICKDKLKHGGYFSHCDDYTPKAVLWFQEEYTEKGVHALNIWALALVNDSWFKIPFNTKMIISQEEKKDVEKKE